jgi:hypothetical protein
MGDAILNRLAALAAVAAAAVVTAAGPAVAQETLGRLFFTPAQRASLDVARSQRARATLSTDKTEEQEEAPAAQTIMYGGMVRRSDGKSTVWINNRPLHDNEQTAGMAVVGRVRPDGGVSLQVPQSGRTVTLKPGQSIELLSGAIEEGYSRKPVPTDPAPAAKPVRDPTAAKQAAAEQRDKEQRDREDQQRKLEEAVRALQEAAAKSGTAPVTTLQQSSH